MERKVVATVTGSPAIDGAGVHLVRVLGHQTMQRFDPFLMLDAFDSINPQDYIKGFPMHPHRGIETFTYLMAGRIDHRDSLGNQGTIHGGEGQWMTAGSGILHEEMPQPTERILGLQLWMNLPAQEKMAEPAYLDIRNDAIPEVAEENSAIRVVAGAYQGRQGARGRHLPATVLDITVEPDKEFSMESNPAHTLFVYIVSGSGIFGGGGQEIQGKHAVLMGQGNTLTVKAGHAGIRIFLATAPPLGEPIAWGGPIVMNTREELEEAFAELENGTFIKHNPANE